jgi:hypothetical protein
MRWFEKIKAAFQYDKASKLFNAGHYEEALYALSRVRANAETEAKIVLFTADIRYRMQKFELAKALYQEFQDHQLMKVSSEADRRYLLLYSQYFRGKLLRGDERSSEEVVTKDELLSAAKEASYLIRGEFVPPDTT